jgi:glycoprotein-N-acetylgalactosamine 3-beta-galactosyltransferase
MLPIRSSRIFYATVIFVFIFYLSINSWINYHQLNLYTQNNTNPQVRILCLISTSPKYFATRASAVNQTWAPRCDKFTFISEYSNDTKGLPIAPIANITPGYDHLTQKSALAFHYVYENFINDFDWFVKADDDTYLFVENLKSFLKDKNTSLPITFGYNFKVCISY